MKIKTAKYTMQDYHAQLRATQNLQIENKKIATEAAALLARVTELEAFVRMVDSAFCVCDFCGGTGVIEETDDECRKCNSGLRVASFGVMFVEIPAQAAALLKKDVK